MSITERLADAAGQALLSPATVSSVERLSARFVRVGITVSGKGSFAPGTKVQLRPRAGTMKLRTYTPISWAAGETSVVAYSHGDGPASEFFASVAVGDPCPLMGPRKSIELASTGSRVIVVGDETSVGLACAFGPLGRSVSFLFEGSSELPSVLDGLGLGDRVLPRPELLTEARALAGDTPYDVVVTGDATLVHAVRRAVREWPNPPRRVLGKAYWAAGRSGLD
jgi:ferric-chelate reductase (NADPH)